MSSKVKRLSPVVIREIQLQNKARHLAGLRTIRVTVRECLSCKELFESDGNRMCGCQNDKGQGLKEMFIGGN